MLKSLRFVIFIITVTFMFLLTSCDDSGSSGGGGSGDPTPPDGTYAIMYNGNNNTGGTVPVDNTAYEDGDTVTVLGNTGNLVREGYVFNGWGAFPHGDLFSYDEGDTFVIGDAVFTIDNEDIVLYAHWEQVIFHVTYDGNGSTSGTAPVDSNDYENGDTVTILDNTGSLVKDGYGFAGWNTKSDGSGTSYAASDIFSMGSEDVTLYAQWERDTFYVTYNGNGSTGGTVPVDLNGYKNGYTVTVQGNTGSLVRIDYAFMGWNTSADGSGTSYTTSDTFSMGSEDVTLYAQWERDTFYVTYNGNGSNSGSVPEDSTGYQNGDTVTVLANTGSLAKGGFSFEGWNTAANGSETSYSAGNTFTMGTEDITLYARWDYEEYSIGDTGPAGGLIFYDKGSASDGWRYLEAAPSDQSSGIIWGLEFEGSVWQGTAIGSGETLTTVIVNQQGSNSCAARICYDLTLGGYDDWFLPSRDELLQLNSLYVLGLGSFSTSAYWSSSGAPSGASTSKYAWYVFIHTKADYSGIITNTRRVRAIRSF